MDSISIKDGALLGVGGVLAAAGKVFIDRAFRARKDDRDDRSKFRLELMERITRLEARVETLEKERADLIARLAHKDVEIAKVQAERDQLREENEILSSVNAEQERELVRLRGLVVSRAAGAGA